MNPELKKLQDAGQEIRVFDDLPTPPEVKFHTARLISMTQPSPEIVDELGVDSPEGLTAYITRVSNPNNQSNEDIEKLIRYCCKHGHWSVLEHVFLTFEIFTTRDISAQIIRHRSFTFQEFSQRYATTHDLPAPYEEFELRYQDTKNRQKSIHSWDKNLSEEEQEDLQNLYDAVKENMARTYALYERLLTLGIAKESARRLLPMASATRIYMSGNLRNFIFYVKSRNSADGKAQYEHNLVADEIQVILEGLFPTVAKALFS